jgi:predicted DNA-binding WGR domain protein
MNNTETRQFTFAEGTSNKFWNITLDGTTHTVQYGRVGTTGQAQAKTFDTETEAKASYTKLIAEKVKKGYVESGEGATTVAATTTTATPKAAKTAKSTKTVEPEVPQGIDENPPKLIRLTEKDYDKVRELDPQPPKSRPATRPFDKEKCFEILEDLQKDYYYSWKWSKAKIDLSLSKEEAHFWIEVVRVSNNFSNEKVKTAFLKKRFDTDIKLNDAENCMDGYYANNSNVIIPFYVLFGMEGIIHYFMQSGAHSGHLDNRMKEFYEHVFAYLTEEEKQVLRQGLIGMPPHHWAIEGFSRFGMQEEVRKSIAGLASQGQWQGHYYYNVHFRYVLCISDPDLLVSELHRLKQGPSNQEEVRALLARTETRGLDVILQMALAATAKSEAEGIVKGLCLVEMPEAAPYILDCATSSKAVATAREWLSTHIVHAIEGLLPLTIKTGKQTDAALDYFRGLKKQGHGDLIARKLEGQPEEIVKAVTEKVVAREEVSYPAITETESPDWMKATFGGNLTVPDLPANENPERRVKVEIPPATVSLAKKLPDYVPLATPNPFDLEACIAKLLTYYRASGSYSYWDVYRIEASLPLSQEEAHFWLEATNFIYSGNAGKVAQQKVENHLRGFDFTGEPRKNILNKTYDGLWPAIWMVYGWETTIKRWINAYNYNSAWMRQLLTHTPPETREKIQQWLISRIKEKQKSDEERQITIMAMMDDLGILTQEYILAVMEKSKSDGYWYGQQYLPYILRLSDKEQIIRHTRRLHAYPENVDKAMQLIGRIGFDGLDIMTKTIQTTYGDKAGFAKALTQLEGPEVAPQMVVLKKSPSTKTIARAWLDANPAFAIDGLAPLTIIDAKSFTPVDTTGMNTAVATSVKNEAESRKKDKLKEVELAIEHLREMKRRGWRWLIEKRIANMPEEVKKAVQVKVLDHERNVKPTPTDKTLAAMVPPVLTQTESGLRALTVDQMTTIVAELRVTPLAEAGASPLLEAVKLNGEPASRDRFVWAVFEDWQSGGAPSKNKWQMESLGHLGRDGVAIKLSPLVRQWPGESQHARAVMGLDCLRAIGTDTALMLIHGISEKVAFKAIKQKAGEMLEAIAEQREMSRDELEDRIVPDCGFDEKGKRVLDFGPRQFVIILGTDMKPQVREMDGTKKPDLPKPTTKDDIALAEAAVATWKTLKKQIADVAKTQASRLEQGMVTERRWTIEEFEMLLVRHPLMTNIAQRLIWGAFDEKNNLLGSFRITEDFSYANQTDDAFAFLENTDAIGIAHPAYLSEASKGAWGEVLGDYEMIPPFVQLGRPVYELTEAEQTATIITRFKESTVDPKVLCFGLENLNWLRGGAQDGGGFYEHIKAFPKANITACVVYEPGMWMGGGGPGDHWEDQNVTEVYFVRGSYNPRSYSDYPDSSKAIPLSEVPPFTLSEVLYDVARLTSKGVTKK